MRASAQGRGADGSSARRGKDANTAATQPNGLSGSVLNNRSPQYELIQPLDGPSIHADWLEERGEGFHHIGYVVESLERTTAEMEASGHPAIARIHSFGATGDGAAAYSDTAAALGFLVEAVEPPAQMPSTDFTL